MISIHNKIQLIGLVGSSEIMELPTGILRAKIHLTTNEIYINSSGVKVMEAISYTCYAFVEKAELVQKYVSKGTELAIEGNLTNTNIKNNSKFERETSVHIRELLILTKHK